VLDRDDVVSVHALVDVGRMRDGRRVHRAPPSLSEMRSRLECLDRLLKRWVGTCRECLDPMLIVSRRQLARARIC
jgi:hypothetical protein